MSSESVDWVSDPKEAANKRNLLWHFFPPTIWLCLVNEYTNGLLVVIVQWLSRVRLFATLRTVAYQACLSTTRLVCPWDSPGKNTGVGCCFLLWNHPTGCTQSLHRDWTDVSCFGRQILYHWVTREAQKWPLASLKYLARLDYSNLSPNITHSFLKIPSIYKREQKNTDHKCNWQV